MRRRAKNVIIVTLVYFLFIAVFGLMFNSIPDIAIPIKQYVYVPLIINDSGTITTVVEYRETYSVMVIPLGVILLFLSIIAYIIALLISVR